MIKMTLRVRYICLTFKLIFLSIFLIGCDNSFQRDQNVLAQANKSLDEANKKADADVLDKKANKDSSQPAINQPAIAEYTAPLPTTPRASTTGTHSPLTSRGKCITYDNNEEKSFMLTFQSKKEYGAFHFYNFGNDTECVTNYTDITISIRYRASASADQDTASSITLQNITLLRGEEGKVGELYFAHPDLKHNGKFELELMKAAKAIPDSAHFYFFMKKIDSSGQSVRSFFALNNEALRLFTKLARYNVFETFTASQRAELQDPKKKYSVIKDKSELKFFKKFTQQFVEMLNE